MPVFSWADEPEMGIAILSFIILCLQYEFSVWPLYSTDPLVVTTLVVTIRKSVIQYKINLNNPTSLAPGSKVHLIGLE